MLIGLFDSGMGGLSVLRQVIKLLPNEHYLYYADTKNVPYGTKSDEEILEFSDKAVGFLFDKGCDLVCIACNTATSVAAKALREKYSKPIIGIEPAVKPAVEEHNGSEKRILVLATPVTVKRKKLHDLIDRFDNEHLVDLKGLGRLPEFAEKGMFTGDELDKYLSEELSDLDTARYSQIVLGCTHFIFFIKTLKKYFGEDTVFLDGGEGTARHISRKTKELGLASDQHLTIDYFESGEPVKDSKRISFFDTVLYSE